LRGLIFSTITKTITSTHFSGSKMPDAAPAHDPKQQAFFPPVEGGVPPAGVNQVSPAAGRRGRPQGSSGPRPRPAPGKPYPSFPLTPHASGQFCKKIRGKVHYFGSVADPDAALKRYHQHCDALHSGKATRVERTAELTVADLANRFLADVPREAYQIEAEAQRGDDSKAAASPSPMLDSRPAARQESKPAPIADQPGETSGSEPAGDEKLGLRDYVRRCLDRYYALLRKKLHDRCTLTADEEAESAERSATVEAFKQQMNDVDRFSIEQLEEQYSVGMSRCFYRLQLHDRLAQCLREFNNPAFSELLDAADHETVQGLPRMLEKLDVRRAGHVLSK